MRKENALYLIRLVAQYSSLLRRAQALDEALSIPIIGLALASASIVSGQYNSLHSVFRYADMAIDLIPARRGAHLNLPAIQELTRIATTLMQESDVENERNAQNAARVKDIVGFVHQLLRDNMENIPSRRRDAWNWPLARFRLGPPMMNQWYFFYGLLDCHAQLARYMRPDDMPADVVAYLKHLFVASEWEQLRWKVMEILQGYNPTGNTIQDWLDSPHSTSDIEEPRDILQAVKSVLEDAKLYDGTTAVETPLEGLPLSTTASSETTHESLWNAQSSSSMQPTETGRSDHADPSMSVDRQMTGLTIAEEQLSGTLGQDEVLPTIGSEGDLSGWDPGDVVHVQSLLPSRGCSKKTFNHAGLSPDCSLVYFHGPTRVMVCRLTGKDQANNRSEVVIDRKFDGKTHVFDVSLSPTILAISTRERLEIYRLGGNNAGQRPMKTILHGKRDPSGLAVCEKMVVIGYRGRMKDSCKGCIVLYRITFTAGEALCLTQLFEHQLAMQDMPKSLSIQDMGKHLVAITDKQHRVLVWDIEGDVVQEKPMVVKGYQHTPV
ncbi:MAG: hypothetical protein Q9183_006070 [Haloplaca sp. 2 TL-2023]